MNRLYKFVLIGIASTGALAAEDISVWILVSGSEKYKGEIAKELMTEISLHPSIVQAVDWTTATRHGGFVETAPQFLFEVTVVDLDVGLLANYVASLEYGDPGNVGDEYHELVDAFHYPRSGWVTGLCDNLPGIAAFLVREFLDYAVPVSLEEARGIFESQQRHSQNARMKD